MGLFSILLACFLISPIGERSVDPEDPEKARRGVELAAGDDDDNEQQSHDPGANGDVEDDKESIRDSDPQDDGEDEPEEPSRNGRRVTFGSPSGESGPPSEKGDVKPGFLTRVKAVLFPPLDEGKPLSTSDYRTLPIISGLIIPFSILLEIPGLTDDWYIRTDANVVIERRPNPVLLDIALGFSMFFALVANISLICRFLDKGPVLVMTLITIASLTIHDSINISAVVAFGVLRRFDDGFTYAQGYWMTVCSTIVSTITNLTLIWDLVRTRNFARGGSGVSRRQRALLIIVMLLLVYIAFGALVNSFLIHLDFINALYFTVVSIETVGFGDIVPDNTGSRVFMCFYIVFGILNLGVAVGVARETIFERLQSSYQKRIARIRQNYRDHRRWRSWERKWKRAVDWRLREIPAEVWVPDLEGDSDSVVERAQGESGWALKLRFSQLFHVDFQSDEHHKHFQETGEIRGVTHGHPGTHLNVEALTNGQLEAAAVESGIPLCVLRELRRRRAHVHRTQTMSSDSSSSIKQHWRRWFWSRNELPPTESPTTPFMRGLEDMTGMLTKFAIATTGIGMNRMPAWANATTQDIQQQQQQQQQRYFPRVDSVASETTTLSDGPSIKTNDDLRETTSKEERRVFWAKLVVALSLFIVFWLVGAALFVATEKWTFGIAVYFCFMTFTTTGYGDYSPQTPAGRSVFVFWALLGLATMTILVSVLQDAFSSKYKNALHSGAFKDAVKKYRQKKKAQSEKKGGEGYNGEMNIPNIPVKVRSSVVEESSARAQQSLENLPGQVLEQAKVFQRHIQYLVQAESEGDVPPHLKQMLDDISRAQKLDERIKDEILQDEDARNTLSVLSFERALREFIDIAESTLLSLAERDLIAARYEEQRRLKERNNPENRASGSGTCHHETPYDSDAS